MKETAQLPNFFCERIFFWDQAKCFLPFWSKSWVSNIQLLSQFFLNQKGMLHQFVNNTGWKKLRGEWIFKEIDFKLTSSLLSLTFSTFPVTVAISVLSAANNWYSQEFTWTQATFKPFLLQQSPKECKVPARSLNVKRWKHSQSKNSLSFSKNINLLPSIPRVNKIMLWLPRGANLWKKSPETTSTSRFSVIDFIGKCGSIKLWNCFRAALHIEQRVIIPRELIS